MKKLMTATIIILPILLLAILLVSGAIMSMVTHIYVDALEFVKDDAIVLVMKDEKNPPTYDLGKEVTVLPIKASNQNLDFTVEDESLLKVENGILIPKFYGETFVTVTSRENKAVSIMKKVIITDDTVHKIVMNEGYLTDLYQGNSQQLSVKIYPAEANNKAIKWSSDNSSIVRVSENGMVTAVGAGTATITATSVDNESVKATAQIVSHIKVEDISFDNSLVITSLSTAQFPTVIDTFGSDITKFEYFSNNENIATVDDTGKIVFRDTGRVTITVRATDFGGNFVEATKEYVSTMGYFVGPLFTNKEIELSQWSDETPIRFAQALSGAYQEITEIQCLVDGIGQDCLDEDYMRDNLEIKFLNGMPEFTDYITVIVRAKVYDFKTDALTNYEDSFTIRTALSANTAKVTYQGEELSTGTPKEIKFDNIDQRVVIEVENLGDLEIKIDDTAYVSATISGNKITLTSKKVCSDQNMYLTIGSKTYVLKLSVAAKAEGLIVSCDGRQLTADGQYQTLLDTLTFNVRPKRSDGQQMTNGKIQYELDDSHTWIDVVDQKLTIKTELLRKIKFRCDDQEFSIGVQKVSLKDFGVNISVIDTNGVSQTIYSASSVMPANTASLNLSNKIQDNLTVEVLISSDYLGGVGDQDSFKDLFSVEFDDSKGWIVDYDSYTKQIIIIFSGIKEFSKNISIKTGELTFKVDLMRVNIKQIEFVGYNSEIEDNVYSGYQQVKVFSKKSYYDNKVVDYFKIPFKALSEFGTDADTPANPDTITWKLSQYRGNLLEKTYTVQHGKNVNYNGEDYTIKQLEGKWVLTDAEGSVVAGDGTSGSNITWVDIYSDASSGMARVYFGDCLGLTESDVYNDYFGAFDDKPWTKPEQQVDTKGGGVNVTPSENAYTFLKVEAGDGSQNGVNCHYNFNVLADDDVINVFDANGYYQNDRVVLQTDLYGEGELGESGQKYNDAKERGLFLTVIENLGKTIIYGNGYQVNFQAQNADLGSCSESDGISVEKAYNTIIKCANPTNEINNKNQKMVLKMNYAYYCDLSYYYKFNSIGNAFYAKNTVFSCIPKAAIQLNKNESLYVENIVMAESGVGILMDNLKAQDVKIYFKGSADILGYANQTLLKNLNEMIVALYNSIAPNVLNYFEWFGKESSASIDDIGGNIDKFYVNVLAFALSNLSEKTFMWGDNGYEKISAGAKLSNGSKIINKELAFTVYNALTYETLNDSGTRLDNSSVSLSSRTIYADADMDSLFTDERYIRLLCEFKDDGVKNEAHILWHKQQAYRDPSLIKGRIQDHIEDLKNSLIYTGEGEDKQLTGIEWKTKDGTSNGGIDTSGNPYPASVQAATINEITGLMKYTIDTKKKAICK